VIKPYALEKSVNMQPTEEEEQKIKWLDEHLPYELKMARYSFQQMQVPAIFYLDWNSYQSAFAVSACNLAAFLTNQEKKNLQACDFVEGFRSRKGDLAGIFAKLEPQVFHLGIARPTDHGKFVLLEAKQALDWIEAEMEHFISKLGSWRKHWNQSRSVPEARPAGPRLNFTGLEQQTSSSADPIFVTVSVGNRD
jgi:hypothetical protein